MASKLSQLVQNPVQDLVNTIERRHQSRKPTLSPELQSGSSSQFNLPDGWIVEERPRRFNPTHVDRYYYEPHTRKQFRSLSSVQRYLAGEGITPRRRTKSKRANTSPMSGAKRVRGDKGKSVSPMWRTKPESSGNHVYNLTAPPNAKIMWILTEPNGTWNAVIDGCPVQVYEKLRRTEAYMQSLRRNGVNGPSN